ncbi:hypothetical protein M433DRAFT_64519 [Acidomyces richmondensis BFW]|nr:hypothetical protein M433DRAFT_64519 [Acidomyces richmondensis BFW]
MAQVLNDVTNGDSTIDSINTILPRFLIVGAGSRGNAYAASVVRSGLGVVAAVVEPIAFKRRHLGSQYIWQETGKPGPGQEFAHWNDFIAYETQRRKDETDGLGSLAPVVDGVFICVKDELHITVVKAFAPLRLHIMCEKPLATNLQDCLSIRSTLEQHPQCIFAIGHVLRYSPHNMLLRHLLLEDKVIGEVLSMEHTEPVGWWHFSHSYVRGQWRKERITAPSLLTKSCHDIDFIFWMLSSPLHSTKDTRPHLPDNITSIGSLKQFRKSMKPPSAGKATNCLNCPIQETCNYSAPRIYYDRHLAVGETRWPIDIVNPELASILPERGHQAARDALMATLAQDYDAATTPIADIEGRQWYGRCVWESDNDVCDDQTVTFEWKDKKGTPGQGAKTAVFHMIAQTLAQCARRGRIYGTTGEIEYDSNSITVYSFDPLCETNRVYHPEVPKNSHHGGGDDGLTECFIRAVTAVRSGELDVEEAQRQFLGVTVEDVIRSHAAVFAAEEARRESKVVRWKEWWENNVGEMLESDI